MKIRSTQQAEQQYQEIIDYYVSYIQRAAREAGGIGALSEALGREKSYARKMISRRAIIPLREIVQKLERDRGMV